MELPSTIIYHEKWSITALNVMLYRDVAKQEVIICNLNGGAPY